MLKSAGYRVSKSRPGRKKKIPGPLLEPYRCRAPSPGGATWQPESLQEAQSAVRLPSDPPAPTAAPAGPEERTEPPENLQPLEYMLKVMNDPGSHPELRARMAVAAARYMHVRVNEKKGKKQEKAEAAEKAVSGRFSAGAVPPRRPSSGNGAH
jgi:phage terminase small subunit